MNSHEQSKLEYDTLLEEYRALKTEIVSNMDSARQTANLSLVAIGIMIAATPSIVESQAIILFLIAPLFFYALAWSQLRYIYLVLDTGSYLRKTLIPNIHSRLLETSEGGGRDVSEIMSWEQVGRGPIYLRSTKLLRILFIPIAGANYGIPLGAAILFTSAFLILAYQRSHPIVTVELVLIVVNVVALLYSAYWGFNAELRR